MLTQSYATIKWNVCAGHWSSGTRPETLKVSHMRSHSVHRSLFCYSPFSLQACADGLLGGSCDQKLRRRKEKSGCRCSCAMLWHCVWTGRQQDPDPFWAIPAERWREALPLAELRTVRCEPESVGIPGEWFPGVTSAKKKKKINKHRDGRAICVYSAAVSMDSVNAQQCHKAKMIMYGLVARTIFCKAILTMQ